MADTLNLSKQQPEMQLLYFVRKLQFEGEVICPK